MEFDLNKIIEKYGIIKVLLILIISFIIFTFIPDVFISYIGSKINNDENIKKIIAYIIVFIITFLLEECFLPVVKKIYTYFKKKKTILKLNKKCKEVLSSFYDSDIGKYNKIVELEEKNKYIDYLIDVGIVEQIIPMIIIRTSPKKYKVSDEYKNMLNKMINKG